MYPAAVTITSGRAANLDLYLTLMVLAVRVLFHVTPTATQDLGFYCHIRRTSTPQKTILKSEVTWNRHIFFLGLVELCVSYLYNTLIDVPTVFCLYYFPDIMYFLFHNRTVLSYRTFGFTQYFYIVVHFTCQINSNDPSVCIELFCI
jgi:hypothetical protein